jgi:Protein of unknown function (DUF2815)
MIKRTETPTSDKIRFHCRTRFMRLEEPKAFEEGQKARWEATFILDPSDAEGQKGIALLLNTAKSLAKEHYGVVPLALKKLAAKFIPGAPKIDLNDPANQDDGIKIAFADGDLKKEYAGYAGMFIVPAHNSKLRPAVANRDGMQIGPGDPQYPYDGCYAVGSVTLWLQTGITEQKYGRRVGINLRGVQFAKDGQRFTQDSIEAEDEFTPLAEDATQSTASTDGWD